MALAENGLLAIVHMRNVAERLTRTFLSVVMLCLTAGNGFTGEPCNTSLSIQELGGPLHGTSAKRLAYELKQASAGSKNLSEEGLEVISYTVPSGRLFGGAILIW